VSADDPIREAVRQLRRLPGVGEKSATRLVYFLLRAPTGTAGDIAAALAALERGVQECAVCRDFTGRGTGDASATRLAEEPAAGPGVGAAEPAEGRAGAKAGPLCPICAQASRDPTVVLVVEHPQDVGAFERAGEFRGRYHVLHGALSPLEGITPDRLRVRELLERLRDGVVQEVILATDPDVEGDATALYLARLLQPLGVRVTRLAHGISVGTEIEYADALSLARALQNRVDVSRAPEAP
jgi:recombination protein RecR